jgi:two-component system, chemotaxis family, sensor kinase CheA
VPTRSLDDVVSLLIQLEPGDEAGTRELRALLKELLRIDAFVNPVVLPPLAAALRAVESGADANGCLTAASLSVINHHIADAVEVHERIAGATTDPLGFAPPEPPPPPRAETIVLPAAPPPRASSTIRAITVPPDSDMGLLGEFVAESREYLEAAEAALLRLEGNPDDGEAVNTIFRAFHTIKGTSGFLSLELISELSHFAEGVLSRVRDREIRCTGGYADLALRSVDMLKTLLNAVQVALDGGESSAPTDYDDLVRVLENPEASGISERASRRIAAVERVMEDTVDVTGAGDAERAGNRAGGSGEALVESFVRVRTNRLDQLIDMVGELVIAQSMISQDGVILTGGHHDFARKVSHAGKIVRELQDLSMGMRMVPLKGAFRKVARVVRDVAAKSGKLVTFECEGEETEIDRIMVDYLSDPLVHMVRNAVDHGLETPSQRESAGKPRAGTVRLAAYHAGGTVVVELSDDGRGLDRQRIITKAIAKNVIESGDGMSDSEVFNLIFVPGFSTADVVTDVSGRGVGMDVVRRNIEQMRGRIEIASTPGKGTTFTVRLPLTLAITDGMLVRVGGERYIVPTINIQVSFRPERGSISTIAGKAEMVMLRGEVIPVVRLHKLFDVPNAAIDPSNGLLMIVGEGNERIALLVDELLGQQQVVAKPLGQGIGRVAGVSGSAILGDGRVGLILDVASLGPLARQGAEGLETAEPALAVA